MEVYESLVELKRQQYKNYPQLVGDKKTNHFNKKRIGLELSGFSAYSPLTMMDVVSKYDELPLYTKYKGEGGSIVSNVPTKCPYKRLDVWDVEWDKFSVVKVEDFYNKNSPETFDTKKYWNYLHELFPFCDVASHPEVDSLEAYDFIKGPHYDALIKNHVGFDNLKNKKILEIGPGYGYLKRFIDRYNIPSEYYCLDIVKRFDTENFIEGDGYNLKSFINEKFDIIVMYDVSQHLSNTLYAYIKEIKENLLNSNGVFYLTKSNRADDFSEYSTYNTWFFNQFYRQKSSKYLEKFLTESNFVFAKIPFETGIYKSEVNMYEIRHKQE